MATFEELKRKGNEHFKEGHFKLASEFYSKALELSPSNHLVLSNRSLVFHKLGEYELALEDAEKCIAAQKGWAKGYARKASALNALSRFTETKEVCRAGFALQDQALCKVFVDGWLEASRALVSPKYDALKKPPWSDVLPEASDLFCDEYCELLHTVVYKRLSDGQSMSQELMEECVMGAVQIAHTVLSEFDHPQTPSLKEWAMTAVIPFESRPKSERAHLMQSLHEKSANLMKWLKNDLHKSLRQILDPVLMLILSAMLVRGNVLCQAYTGFLSTEYLGYACIGFFEQKILSDLKYTVFHMAILSVILNSYRLRGALSDSEVDLIRGLCHKLENLLPHVPKDHKNYDLVTEHYTHTVKLFREICAKVISGFTGSYDSSEALSELELAMLQCEQDPDGAMATALTHITDIAKKTEISETSSVSHINFIDAENMLYITGILVKLGQHDQARRVFHSGESMALSLIATLMEGNVLSLDELPASISNLRKLALSGAIWLKDHFPKDAADVFIHWKSLFTELRAVLIRLGLRDSYRDAFQTIEKHASEGNRDEIPQVLSTFRLQEGQFLQKFSLPTIRALYDHNYDSVAEFLEASDVAIDYTFNVYNPEHRNPPQSQACAIVIQQNKQPMFFTISNKEVYDQLQKWPQAIYEMWRGQGDAFEEVTKALSDALFPEPIRQVLLDPKIMRVFISPDVDLMCLPIDQLPLRDTDGITLPMYERVSVSILSSPREMVREATVQKLRASLLSSDNSAAAEIAAEPEQASGNDDLSKAVSVLSVKPQFRCYVVANPDFKLKSSANSITSWKKWLGSFGKLLGHAELPKSRLIPELASTQQEAEAVYQYLSGCPDFEVYPPITREEATISSVLGIKSPHILHLATHGYSSKQESTPYHGNFWTDESSGLLLAGAQTFLNGNFESMSVKAGSGHMNSIALCGMQLEQTHLAFVSACDSSVGARSTQEMPSSITQALRAAGALTVVSTLWVLTDQEATEFVTCFYSYLTSHPGSRPSEALACAKTQMKLAGKSMFHWGAYVCHGVDHSLR